jgi:hypothetical protein
MTGGPFAGLLRRLAPAPSPPAPRHAIGTAPRLRPALPAAALPPALPPAPSFTPHARSLSAATMPMPVALARPYAPRVQGSDPLGDSAPGPEKPLPLKIYDGMPVLPPQADPPAPDCAALPYTEHGWAALQMRRWVERGEWEPADSAVPAGFERNAAAMAVAQVRFQASVIDSLERGCADLGLPGLGSALWRRASELTRARREAAATAGGAR